MLVQREAFLFALESVQPGVSTREVVEQSSCVVFQDGRIFTYDDEVACSVPSGLSADIRGAVPAVPLITILRKYVEDEVDIGQNDGELLIKGKRRDSGIRMENDIILPLSNVDKAGDWLPLHEDFSDGLSIVIECAGRDETKFELTCVRLHPKWVEGSDNFQMCRYRMATGFLEPTLVRKESVRHVIKGGMTEFADTAAWVHFRNKRGLEIAVRKFISEDYPNIASELKVSGTAMAIPKGLDEAAAAAEVFSSENAEQNLVLVELSAGKLRIRGQGITGWHTERRKIVYEGDPIAFLVSPQLLAELVKRYDRCEINGTRLKVAGGKWTFVACLTKVEPNGKHE